MKSSLMGLMLMYVISLAAQVSVLPNHKDILYSGRISFADPLNPTFSMSASGFKMRFHGSSITGRFSSEGGDSYLYVIVDGEEDPHKRNIIHLNDINEQVYVLADGLDEGQHTIELVKLNESYTKLTFHGVVISGQGILKRPERPQLKLEFIGDSNTAGWSAWDAYDKGGNEVSGAYFTFPGLTAKMLNADYSLIGGSSSGVTDKAAWNLARSYEKIHLQEEKTTVNTWNFTDNYWNFSPDAVIINLGANDYYGKASKEEIIAGWKSLIENQVKKYYPDTHVVLVNSYGWAYNEPADYVNELVAYFEAKGDHKVSYALFPWLWGQTHAVVNEHAGFANILVEHLVAELGLEEPQLSQISSFMPKGQLYNGGFEKSLITNVADGWRPHGKVSLVKNQEGAYEGENFIRLQKGSWINYPVSVESGMRLKLRGYTKTKGLSELAYFKILFKDQAQKTLSSEELQLNLSDQWQLNEVSVKVPEGTWSAWVVVEASQTSVLEVDALQLKSFE